MLCPSEQQLTSCSFSSNRQHHLEQCRDTSSLELWLRNHGDKLTQLHVLSASKPLTSLPCPNLADLLLQGPSLMASPGLSAMLAGLPSLRQLTLRQPDMSRYSRDPMLHGMLQQLPALTQLELPGGVFGDVLEGLSRLTNCSHLVLTAAGWESHGSVHMVQLLRQLPQLQELQGLTFLELKEVFFIINSNSLPAFSRLTRLQHLHFRNDGMLPSSLQPSLLSGMTRLQHLSLRGVLVKVAADSSGDMIAPQLESSSAAGTAELLSLLPDLQQLTHLGLPRALHGCLPSAYSALVASSRLRELDACRTRASPRPPAHDTDDVAVWHHVFGCSRQLAALTCLLLDEVAPPLSGSDVHDICECCPSLEELSLLHHYLTGRQLAPLLQLTGLTKFSLDADNSITALVSQLTGLRALVVNKLMSAASLRQLSTLQQLTALEFRRTDFLVPGAVDSANLQCFVAALERLPPVRGHPTFFNKAPPGSRPDVWSQLLAALSCPPLPDL